MSNYGESAGQSHGDSMGASVSTERAPSGLARFFGVDPFQDRRGM